MQRCTNNTSNLLVNYGSLQEQRMTVHKVSLVCALKIFQPGVPISIDYKPTQEEGKRERVGALSENPLVVLDIKTPVTGQELDKTHKFSYSKQKTS